MHRDAGPAGAHTNLLEVHFVTKAGPCRAKGLIRRRSPKEALVKIAPPFSLRYAEHVEDSGTALFQRICELDLEGIVAKHKSGPYIPKKSTWFPQSHERTSSTQRRGGYRGGSRPRWAVGAAAGLTDWQDIDPPARRIGLVHGLLNVASVARVGKFACSETQRGSYNRAWLGCAWLCG